MSPERRPASIAADLVVLVGVACVTTGAAIVAPAMGFTVAGVALIVLGLGSGRRRR